MLVSVTEFFSRVPKSQGEAKQMLGAEWRSANPIRIQSNLKKMPDYDSLLANIISIKSKKKS